MPMLRCKRCESRPIIFHDLGLCKVCQGLDFQGRLLAGKVCRVCHKELDSPVGKPSTCKTCHQSISYSNKTRLTRLRESAILLLGNFCVCCGEINLTFLTVEGGNTKVKNGAERYQWILENGHSAGCRVVCHNCKKGAKLNGGVCPHLTGHDIIKSRGDNQ